MTTDDGRLSLEEARRLVNQPDHERYPLDEARLRRMFEGVSERAVAMITACRDDLDYAENRRRNAGLKQEIRKHYGVIALLEGVYSEQDDGRRVEEDCLFVRGPRDPNKAHQFRNRMVNLGARYDQAAILYVPVDEDEACAVGTSRADKGRESRIGTFSPESLGDAWSRVRGKPGFVFESCIARSWQGSGVLHRMRQNGASKRLEEG